MKHKGSLTPHYPAPPLGWDAICSPPQLCSLQYPISKHKSKKCDERGSFLSKKIKWQHRRAQISPPIMQSLQACQPLEIHIHASPTSQFESVRKREIVANFHSPGNQLLQSGMNGGLEIFFQLICAIHVLAVTNSWKVHMNICIYFRDVIDWTTFIIQWNLSFGTTLFSGHKIWSQKNFSIIFVSITSIDGTLLFMEKGQFFWSLKPRFAFNKGTP